MMPILSPGRTMSEMSTSASTWVRPETAFVAILPADVMLISVFLSDWLSTP